MNAKTTGNVIPPIMLQNIQLDVDAKCRHMMTAADAVGAELTCCGFEKHQLDEL